MSINLGSNPFGLYLGSSKIGEAYIGGTKVYSSAPPVVVLPDKTIRFKFSNTSYVPTSGAIASSTSSDGIWTAVSAAQGIWDWNLNSTDWSSSTSQGKFNLDSTTIGGTCSILQGNLNGVTTVKNLFSSASTYKNTGLVSVSNLTNTTSITNAFGMFEYCTNLESISDIDLSGATNVYYAFGHCEKLKILPNINLFNAQGDDLASAALQNLYGFCYLAENTQSMFNLLVESNLALDAGSKITNIFNNAGQNSLIPLSLGGLYTGTSSTTTVASSTGNVVRTFTIHPGDVLYVRQKSSANSNVIGVTLETTGYSGGVIYPVDVTRNSYDTRSYTYADSTVASGSISTRTIRFNFGYAYSHTNTIKITCTSTKARTIEIEKFTYSY